MENDLLRIRKKAEGEPELRFTTLYHHVTKAENLRACYDEMEPGAAPGVDGVTKDRYGEELDERLSQLSERLARMGYRPKPVRRVWIPKPGTSKKRPLGVPALEDKIVQMALTRVLEAIYEGDFVDCSYGYRRGRSQHDALGALGRAIQRKKVGWIVDADIRGFPWIMSIMTG